MLRFEKVATPFTAVTVVVPDNVPGMTRPPLWPMVMVTGPLKPVTGLPCASCAVTALTPDHADSRHPASVTGDEKTASTLRIVASLGFGSGKFCTFVATYVAIEKPPAVTYSTSVYVLPTGVAAASMASDK